MRCMDQRKNLDQKVDSQLYKKENTKCLKTYVFQSHNLEDRKTLEAQICARSSVTKDN